MEKDSLSKNLRFELTIETASKFAGMVLKYIHREYPNKLGGILLDGNSLKTPRAVHPVFYGCFDWHSCVHGTWMLIRLLKIFPEMKEADSIRLALNRNITKANVAGELEFIDSPSSSSWERMYGWSWFLKLSEELYDWPDEDGRKWQSLLDPMTERFVHRYLTFLPKHDYPIRTGTHPNTAFGLAFALDYARKVANQELEELICDRARDYYLNDRLAPVDYEPSGYDFLSPSLVEADLMSRVLPNSEFDRWLRSFLPENLLDKFARPVRVADRTDGHIVHLDGLNLSRAWCLWKLASNLDDERLANKLKGFSWEHLSESLPQVQSGSYAGEHWLATFAVYSLDQISLE